MVHQTISMLILSQVVNIIAVCAAYCGLPALPRLAEIDSSMKNYLNGTEIFYKCVNSTDMLFGGGRRQCVDGQWLGDIPRCGKCKRH